MSTEQTLSLLREAAGVCRQGERGFATAAGVMRTATVREALERYGRQRGRLAGELESLALRLTVGELAAAVRMFGAWQDPARLQDKDESAVLAECVRSEEITRDRYERALEQDPPLNVKMVALRQYAEIKSALQWLRRAEIAASAREHALN